MKNIILIKNLITLLFFIFILSACEEYRPADYAFHTCYSEAKSETLLIQKIEKTLKGHGFDYEEHGEEIYKDRKVLNPKRSDLPTRKPISLITKYDGDIILIVDNFGGLEFKDCILISIFTNRGKINHTFINEIKDAVTEIEEVPIKYQNNIKYHN